MWPDRPEIYSRSLYRRSLTALILLVFTAALGLGFAGWIANGSALFLAMSESLAAWCM
jgi:hypothetical protein